jgi:hypothetical protein
MVEAAYDRRMKRLGWLVVFALVGCGSGVEVAETGAQGSGGTSTSSSGVTSATTGGAGGGVTVSVGSGGMMPADCPIVLDETTYSIEVTGDGEPFVLAVACRADPYPSAEFQAGGRCSMGFELSACDVNGALLNLYAEMASGPGIYEEGVVAYVRSGGSSFAGTNPTIHLNEVGTVGQAVSGSYTATMSSSSSQEVLYLSGEFTLCRVPDKTCI